MRVRPVVARRVLPEVDTVAALDGATGCAGGAGCGGAPRTGTRAEVGTPARGEAIPHTLQ